MLRERGVVDDDALCGAIPRLLPLRFVRRRASTHCLFGFPILATLISLSCIPCPQRGLFPCALGHVRCCAKGENDVIFRDRRLLAMRSGPDSEPVAGISLSVPRPIPPLVLLCFLDEPNLLGVGPSSCNTLPATVMASPCRQPALTGAA